MNLDDLLKDSSIEAKAETGKQWSEYQKAVFTHIRESRKSRIVEAVAGSGKTTTIVEGMKYLPQGSSALFLAFNRAIADELGQRVPAGVQASTFHALGNAALRASNSRLRLDKGKVWRHLADNYNSKYKKLFFPVKRLVELARGQVGMEDDPRFIAALIDNYDVDIPRNGGTGNADNEDAVVAMALSTLKSISLRTAKTYDFADMLYLPVKWRLPMTRYENIFVDEVQDTADIQRDMLRLSLELGGQLTAVGDTFQAIYGFRGANTASMSVTKAEFQCDSLPLSISYRCPRAVVELARTMVPHIEACATAPDGAVRRDAELDVEKLSPEDMILCRNNAPLLELALQLLAARKPMRLMGDFQEVLESFIRRFDADTIVELRIRMNKWLEKEIADCEAKEQWGKLARAQDRVECMCVLMPGHETVDDMLGTLAKLFTPGMGPTLSSIHKAKGMESRRVWILRPDLMPSKYARTDAAKQQEQNLLYVAITRAREELNFIAVQEKDID